MKRRTCRGCPHLDVEPLQDGTVATHCMLGKTYLEGYGRSLATFNRPKFCNRPWRRHRRELLGIDPAAERWCHPKTKAR